jgi:hypothetical protein
MDEGAIVICNLAKGRLGREYRPSSRRSHHGRERIRSRRGCWACCAVRAGPPSPLIRGAAHYDAGSHEFSGRRRWRRPAKFAAALKRWRSSAACARLNRFFGLTCFSGLSKRQQQNNGSRGQISTLKPPPNCRSGDWASVRSSANALHRVEVFASTRRGDRLRGWRHSPYRTGLHFKIPC